MLFARPHSLRMVSSWTAAAALVLTVFCLSVRVAQSARAAQAGLLVHPDGALLWRGRPWTSDKPTGGRRFRLVPHPTVPWGRVLGRAQELQEKGFAIDIQLPPL